MSQAEDRIEAAWDAHKQLYPFADKLTFVFGARAGIHIADEQSKALDAQAGATNPVGIVG